MRERNQLVDMLKGYACILVVFGHVIMGIRQATDGGVPTFAVSVEKFIWTFHVALFMFLSGYVYHMNGDWRSKSSVTKFIGHKLLNLGVPYFVFSCIYILINSIMGAYVNTGFEISDILMLWKTPVAQYWFIYTLMCFFIIFAVAGKWLKNWQITVILVLLQLIMYLFNINLGFLGGAMCLSFGLGASIDSLYIDKLNSYFKVGLVVAHIIIVAILLRTPINQILLGRQIEACIGVVGSIALISLLAKLNVIKRVLLWICKYSFPIYLLHTIFTAGIRIVLFKIGVENYYIHVISGMVFGIAFPFIAAKVAEKIQILNFVFYPSKTIKFIKTKFLSKQSI